MKRVLFVVPHLDLGGGARRLKVYCDFLDRKSFLPLVAITSREVIRDVRTVIGSDTPLCVSESTEDILAFAREQQADVVYTFYDGQYHEKLFRLLNGLRNLGCKIITNNVFAYYDKRMDDLSDVVLFQTKMMLAEKFAKVLPKGKSVFLPKYRVLYNPVHTEYFEKFAMTEKRRRQLRASFGFKDEDFIVGRFGRNDIVKWGDILLETIWKTRHTPQIKFFLVGVPRSRRWILAAARTLFPSMKQKVMLAAPTPDDKKLMEWMQMIDAVAHSVKIGEGCSNAINEAMFWARPILTNSTPHCDNGQVEQVEHTTTGIVANTAADWSMTLLTWSKNLQLARKLGSAGRKKVLSQYKDRVVVREFERTLHGLFGKTKPLTNISVSTEDLKQYRKHYAQLMRQVPPRPVHGFLATLLYNGKRIVDYIEYRFFNG